MRKAKRYFFLIPVILCSFTTYAAEHKASGNFSSKTSFQVAFSATGAGEDQLEAILQLIGSARKEVLVAAYSFTSKPIASALLGAASRGVDVQVIADAKANSASYSAVRYLANQKNAHLKVYLQDNYQIFHNKFIVVDEVSLETGSFNYTKAAYKSNAENVLIIKNSPSLAQAYEREWQFYLKQPKTRLLTASY